MLAVFAGPRWRYRELVQPGRGDRHPLAERPVSGAASSIWNGEDGRKAAVASAAVLPQVSPTCDLHHGQDASDFTRSRRCLMADKRGLETLEYAVFAVGFVVVIGGVITALSTQLKVAYGRHQELDRPPSEADLIPPRLHSLSRRPGHTSVKLTRWSCRSPRIEAAASLLARGSSRYARYGRGNSFSESVLVRHVCNGAQGRTPMRTIRRRIRKYRRGYCGDAFAYAVIAAAFVDLSLGVLAARPGADIVCGSAVSRALRGHHPARWLKRKLLPHVIGIWTHLAETNRRGPKRPAIRSVR